MTLHRSSLPQAQFQILLALVDGAKPGHEINADLRERGHRLLVMGPGTLYGGLKRLLRRGWVAEEDGRYAITVEGRAAVDREVDRMRSLMGIAAAKGIGPVT